MAMKNKLLKGGVILAVLTVACLAMAGAGAAADTESDANVVICGGFIDGKVINNGTMAVGGSARITEIELPSGKEITILDSITDGAEIGIKFDDPEEAVKLFGEFKEEYLQFISCNNEDYCFSINEDGNLVLVAKDAVTDAAEKIRDAVEEKQGAAQSPFPILGILAGLGIAGVLAMRRR